MFVVVSCIAYSVVYFINVSLSDGFHSEEFLLPLGKGFLPNKYCSCRYGISSFHVLEIIHKFKLQVCAQYMISVVW